MSGSVKERYFLDTNILVYCFFDPQHPKRGRALELVDGALNRGAGIISYQVVQEFLNVAIKKHSAQSTRTELRILADQLFEKICDVYPTTGLFKDAVDIATETKYGFYDALILASAVEGRCSVLYTEDLQDGQTVHGVRITNPFRS